MNETPSVESQPSVGPAPTQAPAYTPAPMLESEARTWAMLTHLIAAIGALMSWGTLSFIAPVIIYAIYKDRSALVAHHGKQEINLQLTVLVTGIAAAVLGTLLFVVGLAITLPLWSLYVLYAIVISIIAGLKANNGEYYRIPLMITFIR